MEAARAAGAPRRRVLWRHVLPNSLFPIFAQVPVDLYNVYFVLTLFRVPRLLSGKYGNGNYGWVELLPSVTFPEWATSSAWGCAAGGASSAGSDFWWMYMLPDDRHRAARADDHAHLRPASSGCCSGRHFVYVRSETPAA